MLKNTKLRIVLLTTTLHAALHYITLHYARQKDCTRLDWAALD